MTSRCGHHVKQGSQRHTESIVWYGMGDPVWFSWMLLLVLLFARCNPM